MRGEGLVGREGVVGHRAAVLGMEGAERAVPVVETRRRAREAASAAAITAAETARSAVRSLQDRLVLALGAAVASSSSFTSSCRQPEGRSTTSTVTFGLASRLTDEEVDAVMALPSVADARVRLASARNVGVEAAACHGHRVRPPLHRGSRYR